MARVIYDSTYNEPKPRKWERIHCFNCKKDITHKRMLLPDHYGHEVRYLKKDGTPDE